MDGLIVQTKDGSVYYGYGQYLSGINRITLYNARYFNVKKIEDIIRLVTLGPVFTTIYSPKIETIHLHKIRLCMLVSPRITAKFTELV